MKAEDIQDALCASRVSRMRHAARRSTKCRLMTGRPTTYPAWRQRRTLGSSTNAHNGSRRSPRVPVVALRRSAPPHMTRAHAADVSPRRATADVAVQIVGQTLNLALGVFVTLVIVRSLGTTGFGEWSTIFSVSTVVAYVADLGLSGVAVRYAAAEPEREADWIGGYATLTAALTIPAVVIYVTVMQLIATTQEMRVASLVLALGYFVGVLSTLSTIFRMRVRNDIKIAFVTANSVLWAAAVILITRHGGGMVALAVAFLLVSALIQGSQALLAVRTAPVRLRGSRAMWPRIMRVGVAVGAGTLLTVMYARIDQVLVFELAPHRSEAGIYGAIYRVLDTAGFIPTAVMMTLFPIISAAHPSDPARVRRLVQLAIDYLAMLSLPALSFSVAAAEPLVHLIFGSKFDRGANALPILMAAYVVICFGYVSGNMVIATDLQRRYVKFAIVGLIVNVGFNLILIPRFGYIAAAWITLLTNMVVVFPALRSVLRKIDMRVAPGRLLRTAGAAAFGGAIVAVLRNAGAPLGGLLAAMIVVYPLALLGVRALDIGELRQVLSQRAA
jgi:O-antigen/teichoic acid export membrane protein